VEASATLRRATIFPYQQSPLFKFSPFETILELLPSYTDIEMSVSSVGSASSMAAMLAARQATPAPAADSPNDGDADDVGAAPASVQAAPAPGTGTKVDKTC
jgi:hypothetical protein